MSEETAPPAGPDTAADRLKARHSDIANAGDARRGPGRPRKDDGRGKPPAGATTKAGAPGASPALPPGTALPEVMASAGSLFFNIHAVLLDDTAWNLNPVARMEVGNILSFMLADDFYKLGGIGKYVVGGVMLLSIYALKAAETAPKRKAREAERKLAASGKPKPTAAPVAVPAAGAEGVESEGQLSGPLGRLMASSAPKSE